MLKTAAFYRPPRRTLLGVLALAPLWLTGEVQAARRGKRRRPSRAPTPERVPEAEWQTLWNGQDLQGWTPTFATAATGSSAAKAADEAPVCSVVTEAGEKLLRISGQFYGSVVTTSAHSNYHLRVEWRWGAQKWSPRAHLRRASGIVVHSLEQGAPFGAGKPWRSGLKLELQEGSCGDLWIGEGVRVDVPSRRERFMGKPLYVYAPAHVPETLPLPEAEPRVVKSNDFERTFGDWNVAEVYTFGGSGAFLINGSPTILFRNAQHSASEQALAEGPIQLVSEGAELFFRRVLIRPLDKLPDRFRIRG